MNFFIATCTTIILAASFTTNNHVKNEEGPLKIEAAKKNAAIDKSVKPHVSTTIPANMVEEKYIAKVPVANGDTIRYVPYFVERKIKH